MGKTLITDFLIYRWRYALGYALVGIAFLGLITFAALYVPGGLSTSEINSLSTVSQLSLEHPSTLAVTNLPYYGLQHLILQQFGMTNFTIKLLSVICAAIAGIGAILLLRRWFKPNVAVIASIIMVTTGQFVFVAQSGTGSIMYILWSVWLLLAASQITGSTKHKAIWKLLLFIFIPLSLYTPLSIYLVLAIISAAILHPHVRHVLKRMPIWQLAGSIVLGLLLIAPLAYLISINTQLGFKLLGIPTDWPPDIMENLSTLATQYLSFAWPQSGSLMTPVLGLGSVVIIGLGVWQLVRTRYTARNYTLTAWGILLIPILVMNPAYTSITFVPLLLLLAYGFTLILKSWYGIFPRNPYARTAGLVPLSILIVGLVISGVGRYIYGYHYDPATATSFSRDLTILNYQVRNSSPTILVVAKDELPFYQAVAQFNKGTILTVTTSTPGNDTTFTATRKAHENISDSAINRIITTGTSQQADRFYVYN